MKPFVPAIILGGIIFAVSCSAPQEPNTYRLKGTIGNVKDSTKVFLSYRIDKQSIVDSAYTKNSKFEFEGAVTDPFRASLEIRSEDESSTQPDELILYIENGEIVVKSADSLKHATISKSKLNAEAAEWDAQTKFIQDDMKALYDSYRAATEEEKNSEEFQKKMEQTGDSLDALRKTLAAEFIGKHPDSYLCLDQLFRICTGYYPDGVEAETLFATLSPELQNTKLGQSYAKKIELWKNTSIGVIAPEFTQNDPDGKPVHLSDFRGKYLLIDFWASWCGPCRQENPNVVKAYNAFKDKGFTILGVSLDNEARSGRENWLKAIEKDNLTWTHVSDLKFWENEVAKLYGINSIPANFLLDPNGKIIAKNLRGEDLMEKLEEIVR